MSAECRTYCQKYNKLYTKFTQVHTKCNTLQPGMTDGPLNYVNSAIHNNENLGNPKWMNKYIALSDFINKNCTQLLNDEDIKSSVAVDGGKSAKAKAAKCPQPSADRVKDSKGRNRIVYVGPKGGKYIKKNGEFVRL